MAEKPDESTTGRPRVFLASTPDLCVDHFLAANYDQEGISELQTGGSGMVGKSLNPSG
jgi:hypothetical protein